jgi:hypothetical protein
MNKIKIIIFLIIFTGLGYLLGNFFPFYSGQNSDESIQEEVLLEVAIVTEEGNPLPNVEVDVAKKIGPPPLGGIVLSDSRGIAVFNLKPGDYFIFFNSNNFPEGFKYPDSRSISVREGMSNKQTIVLSAE